MLFDFILKKMKANKNKLPGIIHHNGIPIYFSPYIRQRNRLGQQILNRCQKLTPSQYGINDLWTEHPDFPLAVCFNVHNLCNERCIICPYGEKVTGRPLEIMDISNFRSIWEEFVEIGGGIATFNNFSDLFAHPIGMNYARIALQYQDKVNTYFVTNGLALSKEYVDEIRSTGWEGIIYVSCHGFSEETFRKVTGVNAFNTVIANVEYLVKKHPYPERIIIQCATDYSSKIEIEKAQSFWRNLGCSLNLFTSHTFAGNSHHKTIQSKKGRLAGCKGWGYDAGQLFFQAVIQANGSLTLCCHDLSGEIVIGNVFANGLTNIWKSEQMKNIIRLVYRGNVNDVAMDICRNCNLVQIAALE